MVKKIIDKEIVFRGEKLSFQIEVDVCEKCGLEIATIEETAAIQNIISDAYRKKVGLLTSAEIKEKRKELDLSQKELADRAGVGIASIKRWENGIIQTKSMDSVLKAAFQGVGIGNDFTGNRSLSFARIKLTLKELENILGEPFLEEDDLLLFDAKYLWYTLGRSVTGGTYAALPHGPQLNNYKELIELIRAADVNNAEPLTPEEKNIIYRVALAFPKKREAFDASHREKIYENRRIGEIIPYSDSSKLTEIKIY